jgi:hypothetical protein
MPIHGIGEPFSIWISAVDGTGQRATNYTGTITFSSSDSTANLPHPFTFAQGDGSITMATVTFNSRGSLPGFVFGTNSQSVAVTDVANQISGAAAFSIRGAPVAVALSVPIAGPVTLIGLVVIVVLTSSPVILRGARIWPNPAFKRTRIGVPPFTWRSCARRLTLR